jgi:hypothetical protein
MLRLVLVLGCAGLACTARNPAFDTGNPNCSEMCGGRCTTTSFDPHNCGRCGRDCMQLPGVAAAACANGSCVITACRSGLQHCTADPSSGCETDITTPAHCGSCTSACPALCARSSSGYQCVTSCADPTPTQCGSRCVDLFSDVHHCGACGTDCALFDPTASCVSGACITPVRPPDLAQTPVDFGTTPLDFSQPPVDFSQPVDGSVSPNELIYANDQSTLYRLDPSTLTLTTVGALNIPGVIPGLTGGANDVAMGADGALWAISNTDLYSVSQATGQATQKSAPFSMENGMTGRPDGELLSAAATGEMHVTDPSTLMTMAGFNSALAILDLVMLSDRTIYAIHVPSGQSIRTLIKVNPTTGGVTTIGPTANTTINGLAYSRGRLLAFSSAGELVQLNTSTGAATLLKTFAGKAFYGATSSPLTPP